MECRADTGIDARFEQAWRAHQPMLLRRARRLSGGHADRADELLAATALKALQFTRHRPHFMEHPKGFLFVVLRHVFVDGVRRSVREGLVFDDSVDVHDGKMAVDAKIRELAQTSVNLLSGDIRQSIQRISIG